jgi:hypothetical protein
LWLLLALLPLRALAGTVMHLPTGEPAHATAAMPCHGDAGEPAAAADEAACVLCDLCHGAAGLLASAPAAAGQPRSQALPHAPPRPPADVVPRSLERPPSR